MTFDAFPDWSTGGIRCEDRRATLIFLPGEHPAVRYGRGEPPAAPEIRAGGFIHLLPGSAAKQTT